MSPKVLIIGAGIGGLTLAQNLRSKNIDFEIFERDAGPMTRNQGWALVLHQRMPELRALIDTHADAPPYESISVCAGKSGAKDEFAFYNAFTGETTLRGGESIYPNFIRANRASLRKWLSTGIDIQWGRKLVRCEVKLEGKEDEGIKAYFEDGTEVEGDILVGSDGVSSIVRASIYQPCPPQPTPVPVGIICAEVSLPPSEYEHHTSLGQSYYAALTKDEARLFVALKSYTPDLSQALYYWLLFWPISDEDSLSDDFWTKSAGPEEQLDFVKKTIKDFKPELTKIVEQTPVSGITKPFTLKDLVPTICPDVDAPWTLIGDAAHPMSTSQGMGANHAIQDAFELSEKISEALASEKSYASALRAYEEGMIPRATKAVEESRAAFTNANLSSPEKFRKS